MADRSPPSVEDPADEDALRRIVESSPSRVGVGRSGTRPRTSSLLSFRADLARARDAVSTTVSDELVEETGLFPVRSRVTDTEEYLARPDLGRRLGDETVAAIRAACRSDPDVQLVVCDGLSSTAVEANVPDLLPMLVDGLEARGFDVGTPVFVTFGRVDVMDVVGEAVGAGSVVNLVGERPGLHTAESLSAYLVYDPRVGEPTAKKSVVSNIHDDGLPAVEAGAHVADLVERMHEQEASGIDLE